MEIIGHAFYLGGVLLAFLATMLAMVLAGALKGGRIATAARWEAIGVSIIALGVFLTYAGAITGQLDLLHINAFWPILGAVILIGFGCLCYGKWQMMKVL